MDLLQINSQTPKKPSIMGKKSGINLIVPPQKIKSQPIVNEPKAIIVLKTQRTALKSP